MSSVPSDASGARKRAGWTALLLAVSFIVVIISNATAGSKNKEVSDSRPSAFTPAGYAFAIWGVIYTLAACFVVFSCWGEERRQWAHDSRVAHLLIFNFAFNTLWTFAFTRQWGNLWVSVAVIFLGILAPLIVAYIKLRGRPITNSKATGRETTLAPSAPLTIGRYICNHAFVSLYLGWTAVACIANTSLAGTPQGGWPAADLYGPSTTFAWGWTPSNWSILMQGIASLLAIAALVRNHDWIFAAPVSWALFAIARQQSDEKWPGNDNTVTAARALGGIVLGGILLTILFNLYSLAKGKESFAPSVWRLPALGWCVRFRAFGLVDEASFRSQLAEGDSSLGRSSGSAGVYATANPAHGLLSTGTGAEGSS